MFLLSWLTLSPLRTAIGIIFTLVVAVIIFAAVNTILAFSNGPGQCTPGGGPITVNAANAEKFDQKWDDFDADLDGGSPSSVTFNESELSSRANRYFTEEQDLDFRDVRVCIHDGYGEATGTLDAILGLEVEIKLKGTMDLTGNAPQTEIDDIEFGKVPGWFVDVADAIFGAENDIDLALEDIELKHTYTPTLTEGQVQIDGVPKP
jgi:hypothetical protein